MKFAAALTIACLTVMVMANWPYNTPTLYVLEKYTFSAPYSCNGNYSTSALFLSSYSIKQNNPDLLYNGACGSSPSVQAATAGNDLGFITDLGTGVVLSELSAYDIDSPKNFFSSQPNIVEGHTYGVVGSKAEYRYILAFTVESIVPNGALSIQYSVYLYEIHSILDQSPGFNWTATPQ
eukprot:TRINITY_DN2068_c0_g1_i1.p1 TRINITY_DN2068_c0_g1~~TRINITY_DN2068_c0_g1_i1.p1  ORF type:complete len:196 (-),score=94.44 TRINITY_DN2068_c0_g1_i1:18-554(-)